jgi:nitrogen fixation protein FixH
MQRSTASDVPRRRGLLGWHVMAIMLGFFGCIFAVNGYFIFTALTTHSGVVSEEPYRKGLGYNQRLAADDRQTELRWRSGLDVSAAGAIKFALRDAVGQPIGGRHVVLSIGRPSTRFFDRTFALAETAPGDYAGTMSELPTGNWIVDVDVQDPRNQEINYRIRRRLWLTP